MGLVLFYHLTRSSLEETATGLLNRSLAAGWRVMLRGRDMAALQALDELLWLVPEDGFLPHGLEGGAQDADQPVLLGLGAATNRARAVMLIGGADPLADELATMERIWVLFDGNDPAALTRARDQWRALTAAGAHAQYWSEEGGRWEMKSEKKPAAE